jgi:hypothetical protein
VQNGTTLVLKQDPISEWVALEMDSLEMPINRYFSNYHAWNYKLWLLNFILAQADVPEDQKIQILKHEWLLSDKWLVNHVSDYCGHHYRQQLFSFSEKYLVHEKSIVSKLRQELTENCSRITTFKGHETLWCHRRAVLIKIVKLEASTTQEEELRIREEQFVRSVLVSETCTEDVSKLNDRLCERHILWFKRSFGWDLKPL